MLGQSQGALLSLYGETLSHLLYEGERVSLYRERGDPPSLYKGETLSPRYKEGGPPLYIERHPLPFI